MKKKILSQVCRYDQGIALRECGVDQNHSTYYLNKNGDNYTLTHTFLQPFENNDDNPWVAVFTVSELGELLPAKAWSMKIESGEWIAEYECCSERHRSAACQTESAARADLLLRLLKQNVVHADDVNRRLANIYQAAA